MNRKDFLLGTLLAAPGMALGKSFFMDDAPSLVPGGAIQETPIPDRPAPSNPTPFIVDAGKSRFGEVVRFLGVHPNDLKISSRDTDGQLSMFDYVGLAKVGPALHVHLYQDEVFTVIEGEYRFVVGKETHLLKPGQTIFLPRGIPHTWIQLTDRGRLIYFLQPAGKMEEFFSLMNKLTAPPTAEEMNRIHEEHGMKVVGPPLTL